MKRTLLFTVVLFVTSIGQAFAYDDICTLAGPAVNYTSVQVDDFSVKNITHRSFQGSGKVRDVRGGVMTSKFTVVVDCGNDVLVDVPTNSPRATSNLQIGDSISFSGLAVGAARRRYINTHAWYLQVSFNDASSVW